MQEDTAKCKLLCKKLHEDEHGKGKVELQESMAKDKLLLLAKGSARKVITQSPVDNVAMVLIVRLMFQASSLFASFFIALHRSP